MEWTSDKILHYKFGYDYVSNAKYKRWAYRMCYIIATTKELLDYFMPGHTCEADDITATMTGAKDALLGNESKF